MSLILSHMHICLVSCGHREGSSTNATGRSGCLEMRSGLWPGKCLLVNQRQDPAASAEMALGTGTSRSRHVIKSSFRGCGSQGGHDRRRKGAEAHGS